MPNRNIAKSNVNIAKSNANIAQSNVNIAQSNANIAQSPRYPTMCFCFVAALGLRRQFRSQLEEASKALDCHCKRIEWHRVASDLEKTQRDRRLISYMCQIKMTQKKEEGEGYNLCSVLTLVLTLVLT